MNGRQYDYSELKDMSDHQLNELVNSFHPLKVPVSSKEGYYFYFRQFPSQDLQKKTSKGRGTNQGFAQSFNLNKGVPKGAVNLKASKIKTYDNPYTTVAPTDEEKQKETTNKILGQFPAQRSLLVINYDKAYDEAFIKSLFQINGKVRRVFSQKLVKVNASDNKKKILYFNIVVYKDYPSLLRCFDIKQFQWRVLTKFSKDFEHRSEIEKEKLFGDYIQSIQDYINVDIEAPVYYEDQINEFIPVLSGNYIKHVDKWAEYKKPKVKEVIKPGYYEFDAQNVQEEDNDAEENEAVVEDFDERKLSNPDYLEKRKSILKKAYNLPKRTKTH